MKHCHQIGQKSLFKLGFEEIEMPEDHELIKMCDEINWEEMVEIVGGRYSRTTGRRSKSLRMMLGLEIAKRKYGLSDEKIVEELSVNVALKYFCGFNDWHHEIPEASSLSRFRSRLSKETLVKLEEANLRKMIRKTPLRKRYQVISDTTCVEANVTYPTDTKLLAKTVEKLTGFLEMARQSGKDLVIRGKQKIKKAIRSFNLKRNKSKGEVLKMKKKLLRVGKRLLKGVCENIEVFGEVAKDQVESATEVIKEIYRQQKLMIEGKIQRVKNRIISLHEPSVRPIFRGKEAKKTEFGPKVGIDVLGGALVRSTKIENENFSDVTMVDASLQSMNETFGRDPTEFIADRGFHSSKNHKTLEERGICDGIQYRGKIPKSAKMPSRRAGKRMYCQRSTVEGKIGTFKTAYGGNKNKFKNDNIQAWVSFGLIAMNATWVAKNSQC